MSVTLPVLHVTLGLHMDGAAAPFWPEDTGGTLCRGPQTFLGLLETWYALPPLEQDYGTRIAQCLKAARGLCQPKRGRGKVPFYAASLAKAPWATARRLLHMLDSLTEAGWAGATSGKDTPQRMADMAKLREQLVKEDFAPATQRLDRIIETTQAYTLPQPLKLKLLEAPELWPARWRTLFDNLAQQGVTVDQWSLPQVAATGNLGKLHTFLDALVQKNEVTQAESDLEPDNSLILLSCGTMDEAAESIALLLQHQASEQGAKTALLHSTTDPVLDQALARFHLPVSGYALASSHNAILQLLPLCLRLHWKPRNAQTILDFLLLDVSPLADALWVTTPEGSQNLRWGLRKALCSSPGIGNPDWTAAEADIVDKLSQYGNDGQAIDSEKQARGRWNTLRAWFFPDKLYEKDDGLPIAAIKDVCARLITWASGKKQTPHHTMLAILKAQCNALVALAEKSGETTFPMPLLESMLAEISGTYSLTVAPQAAPWAVVEHPGQLHTSCDTLVWWVCTRPNTAGSDRYLWRQSELAWLKANDIMLDDPDTQQKLVFESFCRALRLTGKTCVLVLPARNGGEETEPHPFLDIVDHYFAKAGGLGLLRRTPQDILAQPKLAGKPTMTQMDSLSLPVWEKEWELHAGQRGLGEKTSPSRLHTLFDCPFNYFVSDIPGADPSASYYLNDASAWIGTFAHRLLQDFVNGKIPKDPAKYMEECIEAKVDQWALPLRLPENNVTFQDFVNRMPLAAESLAQWMRGFGKKAPRGKDKLVDTEKPGNTALEDLDTNLKGNADMVWNVGERHIVWDLKWSQAKKYRTWLDKGEAWQLAAYMLMFKATDVAYWLLKSNELIGTKNSGVDKGNICKGDMETSCKNLLDKLATVKQELQEGKLTRARKKDACNYCSLGFICGGAYGN